MRLPRRPLLRQLRKILFFALLAFGASVSYAQSPSQLPQKWDESVRSLAENIAAAASPARAISLEMKNISSLGAADVSAIRQSLESDLANGGIRLAQASSTEVHVELTLSESAEQYVWVAETHSNDAVKTSIVDVPRQLNNPIEKAANSVVVSRRLIWRQPGKFLDFVTYTGFDGAYATLWILEPERVVIYRNDLDQPLFDRVAGMPHHAPWPRDLRGSFDVPSGGILLPGMVCGLTRTAVDLHCSVMQIGKNGSATGDTVQVKIEGRSGADLVVLQSKCGGDSVILATGTADWTQTDSIQAYLEKDGRAVSAGDPVETDGPVIVFIRATEIDGAAHAIVHNLKTGDYEGYLVTATCSH
jgi:hypothetical protein